MTAVSTEAARVRRWIAPWMRYHTIIRKRLHARKKEQDGMSAMEARRWEGGHGCSHLRP